MSQTRSKLSDGGYSLNSHNCSLHSHTCAEGLFGASSRSSTPYSASPRRLAPPLEHLKMTANQPPSAASALADASTIDASIVDHYTDRTGRSSPSQRRPRRRPSTRLTRAMSSSLEKRGSGVRISDVVRISDGYADFLSVGIRISHRWVPRNRVGAFILRSEDPTAIRSWPPTGVKFKLT